MHNRISRSKVWLVLGQSLYIPLVLLGLPLLGWGLDALPAFFGNPVRAAFAIVVGAQALIHAWLVSITPPEPDHEHRFDLARWHFHMFEIIVVTAAFGDRRGLLAWDQQTDSVRWIGLAVYLTGAVLAIWSQSAWIRHLRTQAALALNHPVLIYEGPYKLIRYPPFLYLILYSLGFVLIFRSWLGIVLMIPLLGNILNRIDSLEKIFAEQYKKIWALRCHNSKRLIPFLY